MTGTHVRKFKDSGKLETLHIQRLIPASPGRVFAAWTDPEELKKWWGPEGVRCLTAEVDLHVGGQYRIANELPDGTVLWIAGEFEAIERPRLLIYTWIVETVNPTKERVSVGFEPHRQGTMLSITHELISTIAVKERHQHGWLGCLDGLVEYMGETTVP
jgi:uncharacterized protein YndB with AHSA1/START domain